MGLVVKVDGDIEPSSQYPDSLGMIAMFVRNYDALQLSGIFPYGRQTLANLSRTQSGVY
jgi:hypothetical protein